jgi:hypothetical protein
LKTPWRGLKLSAGTLRDEKPIGRRLSVKSNVDVALSTLLGRSPPADAASGIVRMPAATNAATTVLREARISHLLVGEVMRRDTASEDAPRGARTLR